MFELILVIFFLALLSGCILLLAGAGMCIDEKCKPFNENDF